MEERLDFVVSIICRRPALPILNNIKMEACGNKLKRTANCLEMNIETSMTAEVEKEGSTTTEKYTPFPQITGSSERKILPELRN